jgi:hypothetical protein
VQEARQILDHPRLAGAIEEARQFLDEHPPELH